MNRIRGRVGGLGLSLAQARIIIQVKHYKKKRNNETIQTKNIKYRYKCKLNKFWNKMRENQILQLSSHHEQIFCK